VTERTEDTRGMDYLESLPRRWVTLYLPLGGFLFVLLFPFYWMTMTSFKPDAELLSRDANPFWIQHPTIAHFEKLLFHTSYPEWMWNTIIVSVVATFVSLIASVFAAYAIERLRFRGSKSVGMAIFSLTWCRRRSCLYRSPPSLLNWDSSIRAWALMLTYPTFLIPFCTWLLMGYFRSIP
jgi:multiple sugar transport system permease protein